VREPCALDLEVRCPQELGPADAVECQLPNSWLVVNGPTFTRALQTVDPQGEHFVSAMAPQAQARLRVEVLERHLNFPEGKNRHGRLLRAVVREGRVAAGSPVHIRYANTYAPYVAERETLWVRAGGRAPERPPQLTVLSGAVESLRLIVPSGVEPGRPFSLLLVSLDRFDNASSSPYENETLLLCDGTVVKEGISFRGSLRLPLALPREGVFRFRLGDVFSNPLRVAPGLRGPYWGDLHIHTKLSSDGQGTDPYHYAREVSGLDFAATTDHIESLGDEGYAQTLHWARDAYEPGTFATLLAEERNPSRLSGHHNAYYRDEEAFVRNSFITGNQVCEPALSPSLLDPARMMLIPHHTGIVFGDLLSGETSTMDWGAWSEDPGLRPVLEIYSHHGQSECYAPQHCLAYELNRMRNPERRSNSSLAGAFYAQDYWQAGRRTGVIASSDQHSGQGGRRHGGLAAVWAGELTREGLFDALRARRCYATTGERILLDFTVAGIPMGGVGSAARGDALPIRLKVWGTATLLRVEVLRFRFGLDTAFSPVVSRAPRPEGLDVELAQEDRFTGPCIYYARVMQEPLAWPDMAWSSPVWIDPR